MKTLTITEPCGAEKLNGPAMAAESDGWTQVHQADGLSFFVGCDAPNEAHLVDGADFMEDGYFDYDDAPVGQEQITAEQH